VFVAALAELRRGRAGDVGLDRLRDAVDGEAQYGGLGTIDANRQLGPRIVLADAHVRDAGGVLHQRDRLLLDPFRVVEVMTANLERQTGIVAAAEDAIELEVAAARVRADDGARNARQPAPQVL